MVRPWHRRLIAGLSPRRPGFDHRSFHVKCLIDKVGLGRGFLQVFLFSCQYHSTNAYLCVASNKTNGRRLGTLQKSVLFRKSRSIIQKCTMTFFLLSYHYLLACLLACLLTYLLTHSLTHSLTHLLTYLLTYSMEQSPSWEANSKLCR
jgi:hypothetical protein